MQKSMPKKCRKLMPKGSKMMPKWMPKSMNFHTFPKKAKTLQTLCFPIYFDVLGMQSRCKINEKSMQNRCWKKAYKKLITQSVTAAPQDFWPFQVRRFVVGFGLGLWPIQCATLAGTGHSGVWNLASSSVWHWRHMIECNGDESV